MISLLKYHCYKVLPLVYDDSLSYYEILAKVTAKLNEVIKNDNDLNEKVNSFLERFDTNLLKVVTEILDNMLETGELADILRDLTGMLVSLKDFGAVGDGENDDTEAYNEFLASDKGLKYIPSGSYLINGTVHTVTGMIGNNITIDDYYTLYNRNYKAGFNYKIDNVNTASPSCTVYTESNVDYNTNTPFSGTRLANIIHRLNAKGITQNAVEPYTPNFTNVASLLDIEASGNVGFTGYTARIRDRNATENPDITVYGAPKAAGVYVEANKRSGYQQAPEHGGYMIGYESYLSWNDGNDEVYSHEENFGNYRSWMCGYHCTSYSQNQPITVGILIDRRADARSGFYEGINIGSTAMKIGDVAQGAPGTVGLNFGSWWSGGYGETCIKYGYAHRHHVYKNIARISAPSMRIANENGVCVLGIGSKGTNPAGIQFFGGADYDNIAEADPNVRLYASIRADANALFFRSISSVYRFHLDNGNFDFSNSAFITAVPRTLGSAQYHWSTTYTDNLVIGSTSLSESELQQLKELIA